LPEMAARARADIHPPGLPPMGFPDGPPQAVFRIRDGNHMDVVGQQTVRPHFHRARSTPLPHQRDVCLIVLGAEARLLPPVPPWCDVVGHPQRHDPRESHPFKSLFLRLLQIKN
jgi:hypothetical protein